MDKSKHLTSLLHYPTTMLIIYFYVTIVCTSFKILPRYLKNYLKLKGAAFYYNFSIQNTQLSIVKAQCARQKLLKFFAGRIFYSYYSERCVLFDHFFAKSFNKNNIFCLYKTERNFCLIIFFAYLISFIYHCVK